MGSEIQKPDVRQGLDYWATQPASYDGVLGGFGTGSLPRIDALGSRQFLILLMPELCTIPSALRALDAPARTRRVRALDVGAGVGRVTSDTLLPLVDDVVLVEPVGIFINEAVARGRASENSDIAVRGKWKGIEDKEKSVTFVQGTLQDLDPCVPDKAGEVLARIGLQSGDEGEMQSGFDVIWCQWCLGHLSDADLVAFFGRAQKALRERRVKDGETAAIMVVKENICLDAGGEPTSVYDPQDSSLTRSDKAWKAIFSDAKLTLIREEVQKGFPTEIFEVKMYALRPTVV